MPSTPVKPNSNSAKRRKPFSQANRVTLQDFERGSSERKNDGMNVGYEDVTGRLGGSAASDSGNELIAMGVKG
jgi:hypothetical protein